MTLKQLQNRQKRSNDFNVTSEEQEKIQTALKQLQMCKNIQMALDV